ncbi:MAG: hypothetical protein K0Q80_2730 [Microvirga sp.]|nr:hypothetical protein [Microvirga sp.]
MKALAFEIGCTPIIVVYSLIGCVLATIDFDDEASTKAAEISDVGTDGNLTSKMCFVHG